MKPANPSKVFFLGVLVALMVLTRLPLLFNGYGADGDAWRVANAGYTLWTSGTYEISRPPGYPAHEILSAPLVALGGSVLSNVATLIASIIAVFAWHAFVRGRTQRPGMLTFAFAFAPLFWVNSAATMDYNWSLLMILLAMHAVIRMRPISAGVMAGLAIGFRPTNAVLLVPLAILLAGEVAAMTSSPAPGGTQRRGTLAVALVRFMGTCTLMVVLLFLPVLFTYGMSGWLSGLRGQFGSTTLSIKDTLLFFSYRTVYAFGPLAFLSMVWIFVNKGSFAGTWKNRDPLFVSSLAALCVLSVSFVFFPFEKSYLLSGLPFLLLVLDRLATKQALALFTFFLLSFAFVNPDVVRHGGAKGSPGFNMHAGIVIEEWQKRKELEEWRTQLGSVVVPGQTVIMTGAGPAFWFENNAVEPVHDSFIRDVHDVVVQRRGNPSILYVPMIPREEALRLEQLGWRVVGDAKNREYIERTMGYSIETIPLQHPRP